METIDMYMAIGLLASIAAICKSSADGTAEFGALRDSTRLLPEKLVALLEELRLGGYIRYEESATGNPYGILRLTPSGQSWVETFGAEARALIDLAPASFRISTPERSSRHGGKRSPAGTEATGAT